jgi:hypothetical protein
MVTTNLCAVLERAWQIVSAQYDVSSSLPDQVTLLHNVDLLVSTAASEMLLANLFTEVMESVNRFSPWYKEPAQAFGLVLAQNRITGKTNWVLSTEAMQRFQPLLSQ